MKLREIKSIYNRLRRLEFEVLTKEYDFNFSRLLEIGCGDGEESYLLKARCEQIVATELPKNSKTHSKGIEQINRDYCSLVVSNVQNLAFKDSSFDAVFCQYVLQYVNDRKQAVKEIKRVLKPKGIGIIVEISFVGRVVHNLARLIRYPLVKDVEGFSEFLPSRWEKLFREEFYIEKSFSLMFIPWHLLELLSPQLAVWTYKKSIRFNKYFPKYLGYNLCLVVKNDLQEAR